MRQADPELIIHADRGSQYTSAACRARIEQARAVPSFSRPGNPYDSAQAEASWSTLKTEFLPGGSLFASLEKAHREVAWHLDTYFNLDRRHSALSYRSPTKLNTTLNSIYLSSLSVLVDHPKEIPADNFFVGPGVILVNWQYHYCQMASCQHHHSNST